jgi:hypothetical protein
VAALKCKGLTVRTNFHLDRYGSLIDCMGSITLEELIMSVRRGSQVQECMINDCVMPRCTSGVARRVQSRPDYLAYNLPCMGRTLGSYVTVGMMDGWYLLWDGKHRDVQCADEKVAVSKACSTRNRYQWVFVRL